MTEAGESAWVARLHHTLRDLNENSRRQLQAYYGFGGEPSDAGLTAGIDPAAAAYPVSDELSRQIECLGMNIYWEAKSEPILGQIAVASVTLNRVMDPRFPDTICDVVRQGSDARRHQCHFSWFCDGKADEPSDRRAWLRALALASLALTSGVPDPTGGALWFHADYVSPDWARTKRQVARIGHHIFYAPPRRDHREQLLASGL